MKIKDLENVSIIGLGLLGGSLGLALDRVFSHVKRVGFSHRLITRKRALDAQVVDVCCDTVAQAVKDAQLVVLSSPIGTFPALMQEMASSLPAGCVVTDVGSTKVLPVSWARKFLPRSVEFIGSHPMAGSEQRGVDFARADLFDGAHCFVTPTPKTKKQTLVFLQQFWQAIGMRVSPMTPAMHDRLLARISHLPHVLAMTLVNCSDPSETLLCGKGFLDTTRIASGPTSIWQDILMGNAKHTASAVKRVIKELSRVQKALEEGDEKAITTMLNKARTRRNELVEKKIQRRELPT